MLTFLADLFLKWFAPEHRMGIPPMPKIPPLPRIKPEYTLSSVAVLHGGTLFISSIIHPPGSRRIKDSWYADVEILLVFKGDLKKVQLVGPTYEAVTGMISEVVETYDL